MYSKLHGTFKINEGECEASEEIMQASWFGHKEILSGSNLSYTLISGAGDTSSESSGCCFLAIDSGTLKRFEDRLQGKI